MFEVQATLFTTFQRVNTKSDPADVPEEGLQLGLHEHPDDWQVHRFLTKVGRKNGKSMPCRA